MCFKVILAWFEFLISDGSLFLFDRKVLRYFRKDGHNWRKKKDGKTVKEAHERLKVSKKVDSLVFHFCLYKSTQVIWLKVIKYAALEWKVYCTLYIVVYGLIIISIWLLFSLGYWRKICSFRLGVLMCCIATMPMEKKMKIFKGAVIGCLKSKSLMFDLLSFSLSHQHWKFFLICFLSI